MDIGSHLRSRREALGLTQAELAAELGVTHQHVSKIESGRTAPSVELLFRLSRAFGVSIDHLVTGEKETPPSVTAAIRADRKLSPAVKRHLIGVVEALRH